MDEHLDHWRRAGFTATVETCAPPLAVRYICRIYCGPVPHRWETRGAYAEGEDRQAVIVAALRQAAARYPGVV